MNKLFAVLLTILLVLTLWLTGFAVAPPNIVGTWLGKTEVPDQGTDEVTMVIAKSEEGFSGTVVDTLGLIAKDTAIKDVKLQDKELVFHFPLVDGNDIWIKLTVDGEKMTGAWTSADGEVGALVFEKKK